MWKLNDFYQNLEREASRLDVALPHLRARIEDYRNKLPWIERLTIMAVDHAEQLLKQAEYLEKFVHIEKDW